MTDLDPNKAQTKPITKIINYKQSQLQKSLIIPVMSRQKLPIFEGFVNLIKSANILMN
jgi:hypothetical protein